MVSDFLFLKGCFKKIKGALSYFIWPLEQGDFCAHRSAQAISPCEESSFRSLAESRLAPLVTVLGPQEPHSQESNFTNS